MTAMEWARHQFGERFEEFISPEVNKRVEAARNVALADFFYENSEPATESET